MKRLAAFEDHAGFDGVVLGAPRALSPGVHPRAWPAASATPDPESLLVFYLRRRGRWQAAVERLRASGAQPVASHNPYWDRSGLTFADPDGFRIVLQNGAWEL